VLVGFRPPVPRRGSGFGGGFGEAEGGGGGADLQKMTTFAHGKGKLDQGAIVIS
jgi:hypothetical protein